MNSFAGALQISIKRVRKAQEGEYNPSDYLPVSKRNIRNLSGTTAVYSVGKESISQTAAAVVLRK